MQRIAGPVPETYTYDQNSAWFMASKADGSFHTLTIPMPRKPSSINIKTRYFASSQWHDFTPTITYFPGLLKISSNSSLSNDTTLLFSLGGSITF